MEVEVKAWGIHSSTETGAEEEPLFFLELWMERRKQAFGTNPPNSVISLVLSFLSLQIIQICRLATSHRNIGGSHIEEKGRSG
jgi:hypothetical protein